MYTRKKCTYMHCAYTCNFARRRAKNMRLYTYLNTRIQVIHIDVEKRNRQTIVETQTYINGLYMCFYVHICTFCRCAKKLIYATFARHIYTWHIWTFVILYTWFTVRICTIENFVYEKKYAYTSLLYLTYTNSLYTWNFCTYMYLVKFCI